MFTVKFTGAPLFNTQYHGLQWTRTTIKPLSIDNDEVAPPVLGIGNLIMAKQ